MTRTPALPRPATQATIRLDTIQSAEGLFAVDDGQRVVSWSGGAERLFGRSAEDALGRLCYEALGSPDDHGSCGPGCRPIVEARRGRAIAHPDVHAQHADGRAITLRASSFIVPESALAPGPSPAGAPDQPARTERSVVVHLVRAKAGPSRGVRQRPEAHTLATAAARDQVPAVVSPLTPRELEVLHLLAVGRSTVQIAEELTISRLTARNHVLSIEQKLGAHSRVAVIFHARHHGLI